MIDPRKVQLVEVQVDPIPQPIWLLENATASVAVVAAEAGVGPGLGDSNCRIGDGDVVDGTTVALTEALEQPVSMAIAAMAANAAILCMIGQRAATTAVTVFGASVASQRQRLTVNIRSSDASHGPAFVKPRSDVTQHDNCGGMLSA